MSDLRDFRCLPVFPEGCLPVSPEFVRPKSSECCFAFPAILSYTGSSSYSSGIFSFGRLSKSLSPSSVSLRLSAVTRRSPYLSLEAASKPSSSIVSRIFLISGSLFSRRLP